MRSSLVVALVVVVALTTTPASADVLCKTKKGVVVVRSACKRKETKLDPDALGLRGPQGPLGPALTVHDANGALVGALLEADVVFRVIDGSPLSLAVGKSGFRDDSRVVSWYAESQDCSGPALFSVPSPVTHPDPLLESPLVHAGVAHFAVGGASTHTVSSSLALGLTETDCANVCSQPGEPGVGCTFIPPDQCCVTYTPGFSGEFTALTTFDLSTLGLVPPFHVEGP